MTRSAPPSDDVQVLRLVAHELRAHLTVLNGYADLLLDDAHVRREPERVEHALREMRAHLGSLNDISAHLSDAVNDDRAARLPVAMTDFDMAAAAREAVGMAAEVARRHHVRLDVDASRLGEGPVHGDRFQLVTAMRNLLDNACSHGPDGGDALLEVCRDHGEVEVGVRDRGHGLGGLGAEAFEPLRRGESDADGMGLGLSLVAQVARAHGGKVVWQSGEGWSRIGLRFPDRSHA